jgi:hypothetical protein
MSCFFKNFNYISRNSRRGSVGSEDRGWEKNSSMTGIEDWDGKKIKGRGAGEYFPPPPSQIVRPIDEVIVDHDHGRTFYNIENLYVSAQCRISDPDVKPLIRRFNLVM